MTRSDVMDTMRMKAVLLLVAALAFAASPFLVPGFAGFEPDQFPIPQDDPPVQPAGYAFSIWGLIYLWLVASAGFGLLKRAEAADWDAPRWPLIVSLAVGTSWLAVAQASPVWATVLIWIMLASALMALFRAPERQRWWAAYPVELFAGWLTAASSVSIGLIGAGYGMGPGQVGWALVSLGIALALALWVIRRRYAPAYAAGVIWALIAVAVGNAGREWSVASVAAIGAVLIGGATFFSRRSEAARH